MGSYSGSSVWTDSDEMRPSWLVPTNLISLRFLEIVAFINKPIGKIVTPEMLGGGERMEAEAIVVLLWTRSPPIPPMKGGKFSPTQKTARMRYVKSLICTNLPLVDMEATLPGPMY